MFFVLVLEKNLIVTPEVLSKRLQDKLLELLKSSVENTCSPRIGHIVKVLMVT